MDPFAAQFLNPTGPNHAERKLDRQTLPLLFPSAVLVTSRFGVYELIILLKDTFEFSQISFGVLALALSVVRNCIAVRSLTAS